MKPPFYFFVLVLMCGLLPNKAAAQTFAPDTVYLTSGSAVFGKIIAYDSIFGISVINDCGITLVKPDEIARFAYYMPSETSAPSAKGYYNISSIGLLGGAGRWGTLKVSPSFVTINGYQFNKRMHVGLGVGFEFYDFGILPVFVAGNYFVNPQAFGPYLGFKIGYSLPLEKSGIESWNGHKIRNYGGIMLSPEAGINIPINKTNAFVIGMGYHFQELSKDEPRWWSSDSNAKPSRVFTHYNRISFRIGFVFR